MSEEKESLISMSLDNKPAATSVPTSKEPAIIIPQPSSTYVRDIGENGQLIPVLLLETGDVVIQHMLLLSDCVYGRSGSIYSIHKNNLKACTISESMYKSFYDSSRTSHPASIPNIKKLGYGFCPITKLYGDD